MWAKRGEPARLRACSGRQGDAQSRRACCQPGHSGTFRRTSAGTNATSLPSEIAGMSMGAISRRRKDMTQSEKRGIANFMKFAILREASRPLGAGSSPDRQRAGGHGVTRTLLSALFYRHTTARTGVSALRDCAPLTDPLAPGLISTVPNLQSAAAVAALAA